MLRTKSMLKSCLGICGTGSGMYKPMFFLLTLPNKQVLGTSLFNKSQLTLSSTRAICHGLSRLLSSCDT